MTVRELIIKLSKIDPNVNVLIEYKGSGGCSTCGWGSDMESEITHFADLGSRVVLSTI